MNSILTLFTNTSPEKKQKINDSISKDGKKRERDEWDDSGSDTDSIVTLDNTDTVDKLTTPLPASDFLTSSPFASTSAQDPAASVMRIPSTTNN
jgi:hypothetical protein